MASSVYIALLLLLNTVKWKATSEQKSYNFPTIVHFCQHQPPPFPWSFSKHLGSKHLGSNTLDLSHSAPLTIPSEIRKQSWRSLESNAKLPEMYWWALHVQDLTSFLGVQWKGWMDMYILLEQQKYIEKRKYTYKSWRISSGQSEQQKICQYDHETGATSSSFFHISYPVAFFIYQWRNLAGENYPSREVHLLPGNTRNITVFKLARCPQRWAVSII